MHERLPKDTQRWTQTLIWPAECITVRLDVHQDQQAPGFAFMWEVSEPHNRSLLASGVLPVVYRREAHDLARQITELLQPILQSVLDPEPF